MSEQIGIYKITNTSNGKVYIGQSRKLNIRINDHKNKLRKNKHVNEHLQHSWNMSGEDVFNFEVIENCTLEDLNKREYFWINFYKSYSRDYGYNVEIPNTEDIVKVVAEETKAKISSSKILFSEEELISYLQEFYYMESRVPTQRDFINKAFGNYPAYSVFIERFGSFKNAIIEAGLYDYVSNKKLFYRKEVSKEDVINCFKKFIEKNGRFPSPLEQRCTKNNGLYSTGIILKHFKDIQELKDVFGFTKESLIKEENENSLLALQELYKIEGSLSARSIDKSKITRSGKFYRNRFGNLENACRLAKVPYNVRKEAN